MIWTAPFIVLLSWNLFYVGKGAEENARIQGRAAIQKDVLYRRWNTLQGGVYVPVNEKTPPNPYLDVPGRDIQTAAGRSLTLINPAYMTRQVHDLGAQAAGVRGHITSLNPIRPQNAPDPWEAEALRAFQAGAAEISGMCRLDGVGYMRLMLPLVTEKGCLRCHEKQGYKVGDVRGGISAAVPMQPLWAVAKRNAFMLIAAYGSLWLLGLLAINRGAKTLRVLIDERTRAEDEKQKTILKLEGALSDIKMLSGLLPICSSCKKIRDDRGYWQRIETYIREHSQAEFTHSLCPECIKKLYPGMHED